MAVVVAGATEAAVIIIQKGLMILSHGDRVVVIAVMGNGSGSAGGGGGARTVFMIPNTPLPI